MLGKVPATAGSVAIPTDPAVEAAFNKLLEHRRYTLHSIGPGGKVEPMIPMHLFIVKSMKQWRPDLGRFCSLPPDAYVSEVLFDGAWLAIAEER